jgi:hypothetical protein
MTAEIVVLPVVRVERAAGFTARDALIEVALTFENTGQADAERWSDYILAELFSRGFKAVPVSAP